MSEPQIETKAFALGLVRRKLFLRWCCTRLFGAFVLRLLVLLQRFCTRTPFNSWLQENDLDALRSVHASMYVKPYLHKGPNPQGKTHKKRAQLAGPKKYKSATVLRAISPKRGCANKFGVVLDLHPRAVKSENRMAFERQTMARNLE